MTKLKCGSYLFVRSAHTIITIGVAGSLLIMHTEMQERILNRSSQDMAYVFLFYLLTSTSLAMYHITCLADPGFVPVTRKRYADSDSDEESSVGSPMLNEDNALKLRKCGFCGITQPLRARHCEECDHCVRKFDHHCPWLDTCIGENNHRYFLIFLLNTVIVATWAFTIVWRAFEDHPKWQAWFTANAVFIADLCILIPGGFAVWCLLGMHVYLALFNQTTWEIVSRHRITYLNKMEVDINPFHEGYFKNCYHFLLNTGKRRWDDVYRRTLAVNSNAA